MAVANTSLKQTSLATPRRRDAGLLRAVAEFVVDFQRTVFDTYHPERHYMRGPGPACAAKQVTPRQQGRAAVAETAFIVQIGRRR